MCTDKPCQREALRKCHDLYFAAQEIARWRLGPLIDAESRVAFFDLVKRTAHLLIDIGRAQRDLVQSGFDVPVHWLAVQPIGEWSTKTAQDGVTRIRYDGVDLDALNTTTNEMRAWAIKLGALATSNRDGTAKKNGPGRDSTITRDLEWLDEFDRMKKAGEVSTQAKFATHKGVKKSATMRAALKRAREAKNAKQFPTE